MIEALRKVIKPLHYPIEVMLVCVRWYAAYRQSLRHIEELMEERGVFVDHATVHRWAIKIVPVPAAVFRRHKRQTGSSWRMGETVDFLLTAERDCAAARRFLERAIDLNDLPEKITIDKSGANTAAIEGLRANSGADIELRQSKYLNIIVEQDHTGRSSGPCGR